MRQTMAYSHPPYAQQQQQINPQVAQWFAAVDTDRSGRITAAELKKALISSNGKEFSETVCRLMIGMFDGGRGDIDVNGFSQLYAYVNQWISSFRQYDRNQSGNIDADEFLHALQTMGYRFSKNFATSIVPRFGEPAGLPLDGFILVCILIHKFTQGFRSKDTAQKGTITISYEEFVAMVLMAWA